MHVVAILCAAVLYFAASLLYAMRFAGARPGTSRLIGVLIYAGVTFHLLAVVSYWLRFAEPPLVGLGPSLMSLALLIALALAGFALFKAAREMGLFLAPLAALLLLAAVLVGIEPATSEMLFRRPWLTLHISLSFVGYAGWVVAATAAGMYLIQFRELKHKRVGAVFQFFPALNTLDKLSEWSLVTGFSALTLGIVLGWAWARRFEPGLGLTDPKVIWGILAWLALLLALGSRFSGRWTNRQAALLNVAGFGFVFLAYFVAKLMVPETRFFL